MIESKTFSSFNRDGWWTERSGGTPARCLGTHQRFLFQSQIEHPSSSITQSPPGAFFQKQRSFFLLSATSGEESRLSFGIWPRPRSVKKRAFYAEEQNQILDKMYVVSPFDIFPFYPAFSDDKTFRHKSGVISTTTGQNSSSTV